MKKSIVSLFALFPLLVSVTFAQSGGFKVKDLQVSGNAEINSLKIASSIEYPSDLTNILIGYSAGTSITSGTQNIGIGNSALAGISANSGNTVLGMGAFASGTGDHNTFLGYQAGGSSINGSRNVFIGYQAGLNESSSDKLIISNSSDPEPLIAGSFSTDEITINGLLKIRDLSPSSSTQVLVYDNGVKIGSFSATETDPIWSADKTGYYTSTQVDALPVSTFTNDAGYLTTFTESDPIWKAEKSGYYTTTQVDALPVSTFTNDAGYLTTFTESDPIWKAEKSGYYTTTQVDALPVSTFTNDAGYLTTFTESDPIWKAEKSGYYTTTQVDALPVSTFTNDAGYLTSYTETDPLYTAVASDLVWWSDTLAEIATQYDLSLVSAGGSGLWYETDNVTKNTDNQIVEITAPTGDPTSLTVTGNATYNGTYNGTVATSFTNGTYHIYFKQNYWCLHTSSTTPYFNAFYISTSLIGIYNEVGGAGTLTVSATAGGDLGLKVAGAGEFQGLKSTTVSVGNALFASSGEQLTITMIDPVSGVALDFVVNDNSRLTIPRQGNNLATQMWRSVLIGANKNTLSTASAVNVTLTPFDADFIPCMTGTYGADLGVEHNVHVLGAVRADSALLADLITPVQNTLTIKTNSGLILDTFVETTSDVQIPSDNAFYFGDPETEGTWRIIRSGDDLVFQRRESGSWVTKDTMPGAP